MCACCAVNGVLHNWDIIFFFFKQKTAYEMLRSLVGSEMCIRDRNVGREHADEGERIHRHAGGIERVAEAEPMAAVPEQVPDVDSHQDDEGPQELSLIHI